MIITREIIGKLEDWKNEEGRSPLVIQGARQIGKSWAVTEFGRTHYKHIATFNFEKQHELKSIFESTKDVKRILGELGLRYIFPWMPTSTYCAIESCAFFLKIKKSQSDADRYATVSCLDFRIL